MQDASVLKDCKMNLLSVLFCFLVCSLQLPEGELGIVMLATILVCCMLIFLKFVLQLLEGHLASTVRITVQSCIVMLRNRLCMYTL